MIKPRSNEILIINSNKNSNDKVLENNEKINIGVLYYVDSVDIDLTNVGLSGVFNLANKDKKSLKQMQFGFSITKAHAPYNKTVIITVSPRFIVVNLLDYPVLLQ